MKLSKKIQIASIALIMTLVTASAAAAPGGNGGGNGGGNNSGGKEDEGPAGIVVTVESTNVSIWPEDPEATEIPSHGVSSQGQAVFYDVMMDMSQFGGTDAQGTCNHGERSGILVIEHENRTNPEMAQLLFWFNALLVESGDSATHLLRMDGVFLDSQNWPPAPGTDSIVEFNFWEFFAENKKARRQDCAGESDFLGIEDRLYFVVSQAEAG
jgi:hypothetical protein